MIKSSNDIWSEISVVNNLKFQFKYLGKDNDIPVLVAENYFKFPDKVREFLLSGHWWDTGHNDLDSVVRPGKSLFFHEEIDEWFSTPLVNPFKSLFGVNKIVLKSINGNCFNGNMPLTTAYSAFPHTDVVGDNVRDQSQVAFNINLTKGDNVKTGFWSYKGKKSRLDFSWNDQTDERKLLEDLDRSLSSDSKWFQIEDYGPYKLEDMTTMVYNSVVAYPSHFFHNPYIQPEWFIKYDRISLAAFLNIDPESLDFVDKNLDDVSYAWEFFHLDKIYDFHPKKTKTL